MIGKTRKRTKEAIDDSERRSRDAVGAALRQRRAAAAAAAQVFDASARASPLRQQIQMIDDVRTRTKLIDAHQRTYDKLTAKMRQEEADLELAEALQREEHTNRGPYGEIAMLQRGFVQQRAEVEMPFEELPAEVQHKCYQNLEAREVLALREVSRGYRRRVTRLLHAFAWEVRHAYPYTDGSVTRRRDEKEKIVTKSDVEDHAYGWLQQVANHFPRFRVASLEADEFSLLVRAMKADNVRVVSGTARLVPIERLNRCIAKLGGYAFLHYAAMRGYGEILKYLLTLKDIDVNALHGQRQPHHAGGIGPRRGCTPLRLAVDIIDVGTIEALLAMTDVDVNLADVDGVAPLHRAVQLGCIDVVGMLARHPSIRLNAQDGRGDSVLHYANNLFAEKGRVRMVEFLLTLKHIDVGLRNIDGLTPLGHAMQLRHVNTAKLLCEYSAAKSGNTLSCATS